MTDRPTRLIDPVCGMTVDVARAEVGGLLIERDGRTYGFCRDGCRRAFLEDPVTYVAGAEAAVANAAAGSAGNAVGASAAAGSAVGVAVVGGSPVIDEGMRRWYESCACCLSDAFPEIKAQLDAERAAAALPPVAAGICEVAEAGLVPGP